MNGRNNWYWFAGIGVAFFCTGALWAKLMGPSPHIGGFFPWLTDAADNIGTILSAIIAGSLSVFVAWHIVRQTVEPVWRQFDLQALEFYRQKLTDLREEGRLSFECHASSQFLQFRLTQLIASDTPTAEGYCEMYEISNDEGERLCRAMSIQYLRSSEEFVARNEAWIHLRYLGGEFGDILRMLQSGFVGDAAMRAYRAAGVVEDARHRIERWQKIVRKEEIEIEDIINAAQANIRSRYQSKNIPL